MAIRTRVYKTRRLRKGAKMVTSYSGESFVIVEFIKICFNILLWTCFFWILIPLKMFTKK